MRAGTAPAHFFWPELGSRYTPAIPSCWAEVSPMNYCTGCGKSLDDAARFCTNCGIRVASAAPAVQVAGSSAAAPAPAVVPVAQESPATPVAPVTPVYESPAPSSSNSAFVIIISIILLILIGGTVAASLYVHNQRGPKEAAAEAAAAPQPAAPEDTYIRALNLGNYPAATPVAIVTLNGETVLAGFITRDRPDQVMQFYKVRFPISEVTTDNLGSHLSATLPNNQRIRIDAAPQGSSTQVKIVRPQ
jgi:hypothetical protein